MQRNRLTQHHRMQRIARDRPTHHPHLDWFWSIASLPRMRPNNELFISRTTTQRALSDDCTFDRVYTLRPVIERKKANDYWPICNAIRCNPFAKKKGGGTPSCIILPIARIYAKQFVGKVTIQHRFFTDTTAGSTFQALVCCTTCDFFECCATF